MSSGSDLARRLESARDESDHFPEREQVIAEAGEKVIAAANETVIAAANETVIAAARARLPEIEAIRARGESRDTVADAPVIAERRTESAPPESTEHPDREDGQGSLKVISFELAEMKQRLRTAEDRIHELERKMESRAALDGSSRDPHAGAMAVPVIAEPPSTEVGDQMPSFAARISELRRTIAERVDGVDGR